jgi:hypothetical protein
MTKLILLEKMYGSNWFRAKRRIQKRLFSVASGLNIILKKIGKTPRGWVQIEVTGEDIVVFKNYLKKTYGIAIEELKQVNIQRKIKGKIVDSGRIGYGVYVDIGITSPKIIDALIPLHKLRSQLMEGRQFSVNKIIKSYCLYDNMPLAIKVTKVDNENMKIEAELAKNQIVKYRKWFDTNFDRVIVIGATLDIVNEAIRRSQVFRDVEKIVTLGLLEQSIICKKGTEAPGIIAKIGPNLPKISLRAFSSKK